MKLNEKDQEYLKLVNRIKANQDNEEYLNKFKSISQDVFGDLGIKTELATGDLLVEALKAYAEESQRSPCAFIKTYVENKAELDLIKAIQDKALHVKDEAVATEEEAKVFKDLIEKMCQAYKGDIETIIKETSFIHAVNHDVATNKGNVYLLEAILSYPPESGKKPSTFIKTYIKKKMELERVNIITYGCLKK